MGAASVAPIGSSQPLPAPPLASKRVAKGGKGAKVAKVAKVAEDNNNNNNGNNNSNNKTKKNDNNIFLFAQHISHEG